MKAGSTFASILLALSVTACGGGGGSNDPQAQPASQSGAVDAAAVGAYGGTTTGGTGSAFQMLILEDGSYWSLYGTPTASAFQVAGFVQGVGALSNGSFTSASAKDFGSTPAVSGTVAGSYTSAPSISGTVTYTGGRVTTFNGGAIQNSTYSYNTPAQLSSVTGVWPMSLLDGETVSINISNTGVIGGVSSGGCSLSGTVAPRSSGKNVYDVTIKFGAAPCQLPGQAATGVGVTYALTSGQHQLIVLLTDSTRTYGFGGFGVR